MYERPILADERPETAVLSGDEKWMPVCGLNRLISQTIVCARVTGVDVILIWNEGRAVACERMCPHEQADLSAGRLSGGRLCCPRHAASFDLRNGRISYGWPSPAVAAISGPGHGRSDLDRRSSDEASHELD